jgi:lysophospholipase L1-like esterase
MTTKEFSSTARRLSHSTPTGRFLRAFAFACAAAFLFSPVCPAVEGVRGPERWEPEISAFEAKDRLNPPPKGAVVFTGSSTIRLWKTLSEDLPSVAALNRGFGGSQMSDLVHYFDRLLLPCEPGVVVVRSGGNDLHAGKPVEQVLGDFKALAEKLHASLPKTGLVYIALSPSVSRWSEDEQTRALNLAVREYAKGSGWVKYIDAYDVSLGADGLPRAELFVKDMLHFNAEGYKLFGARVRAFFEAGPR